MTLDNVISAAFALSRQDRQRLFETIAVADCLAITVESGLIVDTTTKPIDERHANTRNHPRYTPEDAESIRQAYFRYSNALASDKEKQAIVKDTAKKLGRSYSAIYNKFHKLKNGDGK